MAQNSLPPFSWLNPTRVVFGAGSLSKLGSIVNETAGDGSRVFLVTGQRSLKERGLLQPIMDSIGAGRVTLYDKVTPFPSPELVDDATSECRAASADVVVAIGGGSPLDLGKAAAILSVHEGNAKEYAIGGAKTLQRRGLPFIAVPTTSGASSEVTPFSAMWDMEKARRVFSLGGPLTFPTVAVVDPELCMSMPRNLAAVTGMDAFTSAFESYWSRNAQPMANALDLEVIRLFNAHLERSCNEGDLESRSACALAATVSGIAYSNSTPNVCHAVGSPLTIYWGVQHGQSVGITLSSFLRWNADAISHKLPALWDAFGVSGVDEAVVRIEEIMKNCGMETRLSALGVGEDEIDQLVENIRWDRVDVLPRALGRDDARGILQDLI